MSTEKNKYTLYLQNREYRIITSENSAHMEAIEEFLNQQFDTLKQTSRFLTLEQRSILAAVNATSQAIKQSELASGYQEELKEKDQEIDGLKKEARASQEKNQAQVASSQDQLEKLQKQIQSLESQNNKLSKDLAQQRQEAIQELNQLEVALDGANEEKASLEESYLLLEEEREALLKNLAKAEAEMKKLQAALDQAQKDKEKKEAESASRANANAKAESNPTASQPISKPNPASQGNAKVTQAQAANPNGAKSLQKNSSQTVKALTKQNAQTNKAKTEASPKEAQQTTNQSVSPAQASKESGNRGKES